MQLRARGRCLGATGLPAPSSPWAPPGPTRSRTRGGPHSGPPAAFGFESCDDADVTSALAAILVVAGPCGAGKTSAARHIAAAFEPSAHLQADHFTDFVVNDLADPDARYEVVGGAIGAAAIQFAVGGYTVVLDGTFFPGGVAGLAGWAARRGVGVHYAVLRPDLETCRERAQRRSAIDPEDLSRSVRPFACPLRQSREPRGTRRGPHRNAGGCCCCRPRCLGFGRAAGRVMLVRAAPSAAASRLLFRGVPAERGPR